MKIDLSYLPSEDRLLLSLGGQSNWLITRSLLIKLVNFWIDKLQKIELLNVGFSLGERDIHQEHTLSLEFDAPTSKQKKLNTNVKSRLLKEVSLSVDSLGSKLIFSSDGANTTITLTRKESHLMLEMLANKARATNWLDEVVWPNWLGSSQAAK